MTELLDERPAVRIELERSRLSALRILMPRGLAGLDVLELGCGGGDFVALLEVHGLETPRLRCVDRDAERLARARERFPAARFERADLLDLEVEAESRDLVVLSQVLSQIPASAARRDLLARAAADLRPGGRLLVHDMLRVRPRSRRRGLRPVAPEELTRLLPDDLVVRAARRCTLLPPLIRTLAAARLAALAGTLEGLPGLCGHAMSLIGRRGEA